VLTLLAAIWSKQTSGQTSRWLPLGSTCSSGDGAAPSEHDPPRDASAPSLLLPRTMGRLDVASGRSRSFRFNHREHESGSPCDAARAATMRRCRQPEQTPAIARIQKLYLWTIHMMRL
jgi:hypothetical protein